MSLNISGETLDDLLRLTLKNVIQSKVGVSSTKGNNIEIFGAMLTLTNPRARLSSTVTKGTIFSCLGELLWYLKASDSLEFIKYYIEKYKDFSNDGVALLGAYGPRIFGKNNGINQFKNIINLLQTKPETRQAVIQIFDKNDLLKESKDIPCTCNLQFFIRNKKLDMLVTMRSNDAFIGMPHDIFVFTMIQEIIARTLQVKLGIYKHIVSSLHIYERDIEKVQQYFSEGWQPSNSAMPPMPNEDPFPKIQHLLKIEEEIRVNKNLEIDQSTLTSYWQDLVTLLKIFHLNKHYTNKEQLEFLKAEINDKVYLNYINKVIEKIDIASEKRHKT